MLVDADETEHEMFLTALDCIIPTSYRVLFYKKLDKHQNMLLPLSKISASQ
jgi:hypothetical protein